MTLVDIGNNIVLLGAVVAALGGVIGALTYGYKKIVVPIKTTAEQMLANFDTANEMLPILRKVYDEFKPNGGSSMKDTINRIEDIVVMVSAQTKVILNLSERGHFRTDRNGDCVWANAKYSELTGYTAPDLLEKGWITAIHPDDRDRVRREWYECIQDQRLFNVSFRYLTANGKTVPVKCTSTLVYNRKDECIGAIGTIMPV